MRLTLRRQPGRAGVCRDGNRQPPREQDERFGIDNPVGACAPTLVYVKWIAQLQCWVRAGMQEAGPRVSYQLPYLLT